jgi:hypothetical protein
VGGLTGLLSQKIVTLDASGVRGSPLPVPALAGCAGTPRSPTVIGCSPIRQGRSRAGPV